MHPVPTIHSSGTCRTLLDPCLSSICSQVFCTCLWEYVRPQFRLGTLTQYKEKAAKLREVPLGLFIYPVLQVFLQISKKRNSFLFRLQTFYCTKPQEFLLVRIICKIFRLSPDGGFWLLDLTILFSGGKGFEAKVQSTLLPKQIFFPTTWANPTWLNCRKVTKSAQPGEENVQIWPWHQIVHLPDRLPRRDSWQSESLRHRLD